MTTPWPDGAHTPDRDPDGAVGPLFTQKPCHVLDESEDPFPEPVADLRPKIRKTAAIDAIADYMAPQRKRLNPPPE